MHRLLYQCQGLIFFLVIILMVSSIFPSQGLAETPIAKENWSETLNGGALFEPIVQKDGTLLAGSYKITNKIYKADIMSLTTKGKKSGEWTLNAEGVALGGTATAPQIIAYSKGKVSSYNPKGKKIWSYKINQKISYLEFDEKGNIYLLSGNGKLTLLSTKGKRQFTLDAIKGYLELIEGSVYDIFLNGKSTTVTKYTKKGKVDYKVKPLVGDKDIANLDEVSLIGAGKNAYIKTDYYNWDTEERYSKLSVFDGKGKRKSVIKSSSEFAEVVLEDKSNSIFFDSEHYYKMNDKGEIIKKTRMSQEDYNYVYNGILLNNGEVMVTRGEKLYKFQANGTLAWKKKAPGSLHGCLLLNENLYLNNYYYGDTEGDNRKEFVTVLGSSGKEVSKIPVKGVTRFKVFLAGDAKRKTVFITQNFLDVMENDYYKTTITSVKQ